MAGLADYIAAINALDTASNPGVVDANGVSMIVRRNFIVTPGASQAELVDYSTYGVNGTNVGAFDVTSGAGPRLGDGNKMAAAILNGTTNYWDCGVIPSITPAIGGAKGITIIAPFRGTNLTARRTLCSTYNSGASRNGGFDIAFNQNAFGNPDLAGLVANLQYGADATGYCDQTFTPADGTGLNDNVWHLGIWYMNKTDAAHAIWKVNGTNVSGQVAEPFGFNSAGSYLTSTGKFAVGGLALAGTVTANYNDAICALAIIEGKLTSAQERVILRAFGYAQDSVPMVRHLFRSDREVYDSAAGSTNSSDSGAAKSWVSQAGELARVAYVTGTGSNPTLVVADNGNVPTVSFDNMYQSTVSPSEKGLAGASYREVMFNDAVEAISPNRLTLWAAIRTPVFQPQGATNLTWIECLDSSNNVIAQLTSAQHPGFGRGASVFIKDTGKFVRTGPSLTFVAATYEDGVTTLYADNLTGETPNNPGATPARVTGKITKLRIGGQISGTGGMATGWLNEAGVAEAVATSTEIATLRDAAFARWKNTPRETVDSTVELQFAGDSILAGRAALNSRTFVIKSPIRVRGPRCLSYGIAGDKMSDTVIRDWSDTKKYLATASYSAMVLQTITNDIVAYLSVGNPTPAAWKTSAATVLNAYRAIRPSGGIVFMGCPPSAGSGGADPTTRNLFKAKALELIASLGNAVYVDLEGMNLATMFDDTLHPNTLGHLYMGDKLSTALTTLNPTAFPGGSASLILPSSLNLGRDPMFPAV